MKPVVNAQDPTRTGRQQLQSYRVMNSLKTILVPVDFSTGSRTALERAARLAGLNPSFARISKK
jgi:hypothetical protein